MYQTRIKFNPEYVPLHAFPILALDPGKTIGVAWAEAKQGTYGTYDIEVETFRLDWPSLAAVVDLSVKIRSAQYVTAEEFLIYAHKAQSLSWDKVPAARVLGWVEGKCIEFGKPFKSYMASQAKTTVTDAMLKEYKTGGTIPRNRHERDALRHAWLLLLDLPKIGGQS